MKQRRRRPKGITGDITRFAQAILCNALENAKDGGPEEREIARRWLLAEDNYLRDLILEVTTDVHLDWIKAYVRGLEEASDEQHTA